METDQKFDPERTNPHIVLHESTVKPKDISDNPLESLVSDSGDRIVQLDDRDFVAEPDEALPVVSTEPQPRKHLEMKLPATERPAGEEGDFEMLDRIQQWNRDFIISAQRALRDVYGYKTATVTDFQCLLGRPGHDENDYELTVQVGATSDGKIGDEGMQALKIVVRRASEDALQS